MFLVPQSGAMRTEWSQEVGVDIWHVWVDSLISGCALCLWPLFGTLKMMVWKGSVHKQLYCTGLGPQSFGCRQGMLAWWSQRCLSRTRGSVPFCYFASQGADCHKLLSILTFSGVLARWGLFSFHGCSLVKLSVASGLRCRWGSSPSPLFCTIRQSWHF